MGELARLSFQKEIKSSEKKKRLANEEKGSGWGKGKLTGKIKVEESLLLALLLRRHTRQADIALGPRQRGDQDKTRPVLVAAFTTLKRTLAGEEQENGARLTLPRLMRLEPTSVFSVVFIPLWRSR
jgi:hypothetical protein